MEKGPHLQVGKENRVAVVFSCPGRHEEAAGFPAAKGTGRNLEALLRLLCQALGRSDLTRENVTITNAWPGVEYRAKTGRSEATVQEIAAPENLRRLERELSEITEFVIFCGNRASAAAPFLTLRHNPRFVFIDHLGLRGLSLIRRDVSGDEIIAAARALPSGGCPRSRREMQCANTMKRLEVVAQSIVTQLQQP